MSPVKIGQPAFSPCVSVQPGRSRHHRQVQPRVQRPPERPGALKFKELAEKLLCRQSRRQVFPVPVVRDAKEMEACCWATSADRAIAPPSSTAIPKIQVFDLPFLFDDVEAVERFQQSKDGNGAGDSIQSKGLQAWLTGTTAEAAVHQQGS